MKNKDSYRIHESAVFVRFRKRISSEVRSLRCLRRSLLRRVSDPRLDPGRVDVLEAVVLEDRRKLRRQSFEAQISGLTHHDERALLHQRKLLAGHHEVLLRLLKVMFGEQNLIRLKKTLL
jgi:hypothetical protein